MGIRAGISNKVESALNARVVNDPKIFYEDQRATDTWWVLAVKNVLAPERLMTRARYGQALRFPARLSRAERASSAPPAVDRGLVSRLAAEFRREGVVQLPGDRSALAHAISERYGAIADRHEPADDYLRTFLDPTADLDALSLITDPLLLSVLAAHYGAQPFLRDSPTVNITYPNITLDEVRGHTTDWASNWHWDTPNLLSVHVMISDIPPDGTRMLYAKGSHKRPHVRMGGTDRFYSEEFVRSRYPIFDCAGPSGSIFVFDNNGLHRLEPVRGRFRASFEFYFTPGNDLISFAARRAGQQTDRIRIHENLAAGEHHDLPPLAPLQRRALAGLLGEKTA
ncbi:MAG TPA: hypothetical protein VFM96_01010 [Gaiellaceae bacterium]|nr:hypothetical protein [Gaiellaceae bacterium]